MKSYAHHEYARLFPMLDEQALQELADDIAANGLRTPIVIDEDEMILDGRNRAAACVIAGVDPVYEPFVGNDEAKLAFVISANIHRRHLDSSQRAVVAAKLKPIFEAQAAKRQKAGKNQHTKRVVENLPQPSDGGKARDKAGQAMNVSGKSVDMAAKVIAKAVPEITQAVERGEVAVSAAAVVADLPAEQQKKIASEGPKAVRKAAAEIRNPSTAVPMRLESGFDDTVATERIRNFVNAEMARWPEDRRGEAIQVFQLYLGGYEQ